MSIKEEVSDFLEQYQKMWFYESLANSYSFNPLLDHHYDEDGQVFWHKVQTAEAWDWWQSAKKHAIPDTHILIEKSKLESFYQDDNEPENFCSSINEIDVLGEHLDIGESMIINKTTSAYVSTEKLFAVLVECDPVAPWFKKTTLKIVNQDDLIK